jgi:hypothetical protein
LTWEYVVQDIDRSKGKAQGIQTVLTDLGREDWELVSVMKLTGTIDRYFLKRQPHDSLTERVTEKVSNLIHTRSDADS